MTHRSNLVALCLPEGGKVISKWTVTTVHCQWTEIKPDSQNVVWISWKQILVFLPFTEAQNYILFYVENHLTECNGSFYRRTFYQHRLTSLTLENSCMDRRWGKRTNLELSKSSGKLFCFRIRILELDITIHECLNIWVTVHNEFLEGKTRKMSKNGQVNYWRVIERQPRKQFARSFYRRFWVAAYVLNS